MPEPTCDDLDRMRRDDLPYGASQLASAVDTWLHMAHGVTSSHHDIGTLLHLLAQNGCRVVWSDDEREPVPAVLTLTEDQRADLAVAARQGAERMQDPRYVYTCWPPLGGKPEWAIPQAEAQRQHDQWRQVADWLHPDPYGRAS